VFVPAQAFKPAPRNRRHALVRGRRTAFRFSVQIAAARDETPWNKQSHVGAGLVRYRMNELE
jgi:hypothetical protein